jgi:uncharacterized protein YecE (DUF72 family)
MTGSGPEPSTEQPTFFIGTSGWTYDDWKGRFYPADLPKKGWFDYYASQLNSVEVNATFYRTFKDETYEKWRRSAPQGFGYVLKAPQLITHRKFLVDADEDIMAFFRSCSILEGKFELILLQVSPHMPIDPGRLRNALLAFPDPSKVAVEFRRPEWLSSATISLLEAVGATMCNADSPQQSLTDFITSRRAYLRLHGRKSWYSYNYSPEELAEIARAARDFVKRGANTIYIFFNNDYNAYAPANALALRGLLDSA